MESGLKLEKSTTPNDDAEFRAYIGALLYISCFSRPDISYTVNKLAQYQGWVTEEMTKYAKRIISYFTSKLAIFYKSQNPKILTSYCDASHAPEVDPKTENEVDAHSVSRYIIQHYGNIIHWNTCKQQTVAISSTVAEILAITENIAAFFIPRDILNELFGKIDAMEIYEDNQSTRRMIIGCKNKKLRHLLIHAAALREAIERKQVNIVALEGKNQPSDLLTKAITGAHFE